MGVKRASYSLSAETRERAVELLLAGRTMREISIEVGASRAAIGEYFKRDPRAIAFRASGSEAAGQLEDRELDADFSATARIALAGIAAQARVLKAQAKRGEAEPRALAALARAMEAALKWRQLLRGRPTAHTKSERTQTAPELSDEERKLLDLADQAEIG